MSYALRYRPGTDLGRLFTACGGRFNTREEAENLRLRCSNAEDMETVEVEE